MQLQGHYIINPKIIFSLFPLGDLWNNEQFPFGLIYLTIKKDIKKNSTASYSEIAVSLDMEPNLAASRGTNWPCVITNDL